MTWDCANCEEKECYQGRDCSGFADEIREVYETDEIIRRIHEVGSNIEAKHYMRKNRLEEIVLFARELGCRRLGIAFCIGFEKEAKVLSDFLSKEFEVSSVCCKCCGIMKKDLGLAQIRDDREEAICNPVGQARTLAEDGTDLNIVLGLCVGHDSIFYRNSKAPVTTLVTKDRVLGHNPAAALYSKYWLNKMNAEQLERLEKDGTRL